MFLRMKKNKKAPAFIHCKVTLTTHPKAPWRVSYPAEVDGKTRRLRRMFSTEQKAMNFATDHEREVTDHGIRFGSVTAEARRAFDHYRDARADLEADGAAVPTFEELVTSAVAGLRRDHANRQRLRMTVAEAVEAFQAYKRPRVGKAHLEGVKTMLSRFARDHGTRMMDTMDGAELEAWIFSLRSVYASADGSFPLLSPTTRNKFRKTLRELFGYGCAKAQGWTDHNPLEGITPEKQPSHEPEAYSVTSAQAIVQAALDMKSPLLPCLALGLFAGLRPSEAQAIDLSVIDLALDEFRVMGAKGKGARIAPLTPACRAWLASQDRRTGAGWTGSRQEYADAMRAVLGAAKATPIYDGLRHSFITYRTAVIRDVGRVADESGNSPNVIRKHYRQIVTTEAGERFFSIRPERPATNVTPITEGGEVA